MEKSNPLHPFWFDSSRQEDNALSQVPRDRETRDENAGGTRFHTRGNINHDVENGDYTSLIRKRVLDQEENDNKRRTLESDSAINSDSILTSDDNPFHPSTRSTGKISSYNPSSESVYFFHQQQQQVQQKVPSSPPIYNDHIASSPQLDYNQQLFTSQATVIPYGNTNNDIANDSDDTVDFNVTTLNRLHAYISSDYLQDEQIFGEKVVNEDLNIKARGIIARCIEDGNPKVHLESLGLKTLPDEIEDVKNMVCVGRNGIESPKLEIYAVHNKLRILPPSLFNVEQIRVLSLRDNRLRKIPGIIEKLKNLTDLSIVSNEIKVLPYQILKLPNLVNLLVRPNLNLIELKSQDPSTYFCVSDSKGNHNKDIRRYVSKIKWSDSRALFASSQIPPKVTISDREMLKIVTPVPKLSEIALRRLSKYDVSFSESQKWKKNIPTYMQKKIAKALQKGIFEESCSICDKVTVDPIAKALEWWDFKSHNLVPVRRNFCCGNCVKVWLDEAEKDINTYRDLQIDVEDVNFHQVPQDTTRALHLEDGRINERHDGDLRFDEEF